MYLSIEGWWNDGNTEFQRVLFIIAAAATLVMIIQIICMLVGLGHGDTAFDNDADATDFDAANDESIGDAAGLRVLTLRSALAFLAVGGWMTYTMLFLMPWYGALPIGVAVGAAAAVGVAFLLKSVMKLQSNGNIRLTNAIGQVGEVYLTIPAQRGGSGKVNVTVQETLIEREAVTDNEQAIKTGQKVKIVEVINDNILVVEPLN